MGMEEDDPPALIPRDVTAIDDGGGSVDARDATSTSRSSLTRTLYEAQLATEYRAKSRSRESFHRSMLKARIANDETMARRGRMGRWGWREGREEEEEEDESASGRGGKGVIDDARSPTTIFAAFDDDEALVSLSPSLSSSSSSGKIAGELEFAGHDDDDAPRDVREDVDDVVVPSSFARAVNFSTSARRGGGISEDDSRDGRAGVGGGSTVRPSSSYEADERMLRRDNYVREIWNCVHGKAIERTKLRMSLRNGVVDDNISRMARGVNDRVNLVANEDENDYDEEEDDDDGMYVWNMNKNDPVHDVNNAYVRTNVRETSHSTSGDVIRRDFRRLGFVRRVRRKRRSFLLVALAVVVSRRLFLVYFGNALRLI